MSEDVSRNPPDEVALDVDVVALGLSHTPYNRRRYRNYAVSVPLHVDDVLQLSST